MPIILCLYFEALNSPQNKAIFLGASKSSDSRAYITIISSLQGVGSLGTRDAQLSRQMIRAVRLTIYFRVQCMWKYSKYIYRMSTTT